MLRVLDNCMHAGPDRCSFSQKLLDNEYWITFDAKSWPLAGLTNAGHHFPLQMSPCIWWVTILQLSESDSCRLEKASWPVLLTKSLTETHSSCALSLACNTAWFIGTSPSARPMLHKDQANDRHKTCRAVYKSNYESVSAPSGVGVMPPTTTADNCQSI